MPLQRHFRGFSLGRLILLFWAGLPGLFRLGVDGGVVGVQHFLFAFQPHINIPGCDCLKVHGETQRRADTGEGGMAQHFARGIKVAQMCIRDR